LEFKQIVAERYATKRFDGRKIPDSKIGELLDLIRMAPSSFNLQPWKIQIVTNPGVKEKLAPAAYGQTQIPTSSHLLVFLADTDLHGLVDQLDAQMKAAGVHPDRRDPYVKMMRGFVSSMTPDQKRTWAQRQVYLALGNALNGAKSLGFDSCPMEGFDAVAFSKILDLPEHLVPTVLCPVGYAADTALPKVRFAEKDILRVLSAY